MAEFLCTKVRPSAASYVDEDGSSIPARGYEAHFMPTTSQHGKPGGVVQLHVWVFHPCPYEQGKKY